MGEEGRPGLLLCPVSKWLSVGRGGRLSPWLSVARRPQGSCPVPRSGVPGWAGAWAADRASRGAGVPAAAPGWSREPTHPLTHSVPVGGTALPGPGSLHVPPCPVSPLLDWGFPACTATTLAVCVTVAAIHATVRTCSLLGRARRCDPAECTSGGSRAWAGGRGGQLFTAQLCPLPPCSFWCPCHPLRS